MFITIIEKVEINVTKEMHELFAHSLFETIFKGTDIKH